MSSSESAGVSFLCKKREMKNAWMTAYAVSVMEIKIKHMKY